MLYTWKCKKCDTNWYSYCGEYMNYTDEGWKTRQRQKQADLCIPCFGETPELAAKQVLLPCFNPYTGDIEQRDSTN